jgi:hypothetical protein
MKKGIICLLFILFCINFISAGDITNFPWNCSFDCSEHVQSQSDWTNNIWPSCCQEEVGLQNNWLGSSYSTRITTLANHTGTRGLRIFYGPSGANGAESMFPMVKFSTPQKEYWMRWYMRYDPIWTWADNPNFDGYELDIRHKWIYTYTSGMVVNIAVEMNADTTEFINFNTNVNDQITASGHGWNYLYPQSNWHYYEVHMKMDTNSANGQYDLWIDGILVGNKTNADISGGNVVIRNGWQYIMFSNTGYKAGTYYLDIDDIAISTTGYIGPINSSSNSKDPYITSAPTNITDGQNITITGINFGANGPNVVVFDDFEKGTNGNNLSDTIHNAQIGTWKDLSSMDPYYPTYSNLNSHSGSLAMRSDWNIGSTGSSVRYVSPEISSYQNKIFFSFWLYLPQGQVIPGASGPYGSNWKLYWLFSNSGFQNDYVGATQASSLPDTMGQFFPVSWLDGSQNRASVDWMNTPFVNGRWSRIDVNLIGNTSVGSIAAWFTDSANKRYLMGSDNGRTLDDGTTGWRYLNLPGFARSDTNSNTYYDDIYVASGLGAQARVEIGNNQVYENCTNLAIITPNSWSNNQITATVRQGSFHEGDNAYVFVVDSNGTTSAGRQITFSGSVNPPAINKTTVQSIITEFKMFKSGSGTLVGYIQKIKEFIL